MAPNMLDCTRGNFDGSIVSGVPPPAYFPKVLPILGKNILDDSKISGGPVRHGRPVRRASSWSVS